jgi:hypothetical protein
MSASHELGAAHPSIGAGFQQAQQLDLHAQGDVAHLVEKQGATTGGLDQPGLAGTRASESPPFMAKELALEQGFGEARTVHGHKRPIPAPAGIMDGLGHQLLASARFALQQHGGLRRGYPGHQLQHGPEGRCAPDQSLGAGQSPSHGQGLELLDEVGDLPGAVADR